MTKTKSILVKDTEIKVRNIERADYLSLSDIARYKDADRSDYIIQNWMRNRSTVDYLGLWEQINNLDSNSIEFDGIRNEAGTNAFVLTPKRWTEKTQAIGIVSKNIALFGKTAKTWREENPNKEGNIRDYASVEQLVVLANMESYNAEMIKQSLSPQERLERLNAMAISQLKVLIKSKQLGQLERK